jgi:hypothetical protein
MFNFSDLQEKCQSIFVFDTNSAVDTITTCITLTISVIMIVLAKALYKITTFIISQEVKSVITN